MKIIKLRTGENVLVDDYDFEWLSQWKWYCNANGYAYRRSEAGGKRKNVMMHRLILNVPKGYETDHINRNKLDNQRANLRIATRSQNRANSRTRKRVNKYKGAYKTKINGNDYYQAQLTHNKKTIHIGYFKTAIEAARAYDKKAKEIFGEFARGNFFSP